jgi:hypothetical protein
MGLYGHSPAVTLLLYGVGLQVPFVMTLTSPSEILYSGEAEALTP